MKWMPLIFLAIKNAIKQLDEIITIYVLWYKKKYNERRWISKYESKYDMIQNVESTITMTCNSFLSLRNNKPNTPESSINGCQNVADDETLLTKSKPSRDDDTIHNLLSIDLWIESLKYVTV